MLLREVTPERVKAFFGDLVKGEVERFELPNLGAINLLLHEALGGGGTFRFGWMRRGRLMAPRCFGWRLRLIELRNTRTGRVLQLL